jgi:D-serine deaminase-like pyridoxal phosphate-dependent protein
MERNIRRLADYCAQHRIALWPHTKTHKSPEIARKQLAAGSPGITVAKVGEAEVMADAGLRDILIAYPCYGPQKWQRIAALAARTNLSMCLDSVEVAAPIADACARAGVKVGVMIEMDVGLHRVGQPTPQRTLAVAQQLNQMRGLQLQGIACYPGQLKGPPQTMEAALQPVNDKLDEAIGLFKKAGLRCDRVSAGSTPTAYYTHLLPRVNESRAGTYVFNDKNTVSEGHCSYDDCALSIHATVVSTALEGQIIADAGSKTLFTDRLSTGGPGYGHVVGHSEVVVEKFNEEHGFLDVRQSARQFKVGDRLRIIPNHVCVVVNLHDQLIGARRGVVETLIKVAARGKIQ